MRSLMMDKLALHIFIVAKHSLKTSSANFARHEQDIVKEFKALSVRG